MRLGRAGRADRAADRARVREPAVSAETGAPESSHPEGTRVRLRGTGILSRQNTQKKSTYGPRGFSNSWEYFPDRPALRDTPYAPTAPEAALLEGLARSPGTPRAGRRAHGPPGGGAARAAQGGPHGCCSSSLAGQLRTRQRVGEG